LTDRKEVIVHGEITARSEEGSQKAEKQKEVALQETEHKGGIRMTGLLKCTPA
jgi:hypothetical protein